jgi:SAM-dependent methyltransferase
MSDQATWNSRYETGDTPWDTGAPSTQLTRFLAQHKQVPGRALEIGCGTGNNVIWLAQQGWDVTGVDVAPRALDLARDTAQHAGVPATFLVADVLDLPEFNQPFDLLFDRGCYHAVRRGAPFGYAPSVARALAAGAHGLILAGNAKEPREPGPPVVAEEELRRELGLAFTLVSLEEFRFDVVPGTDVAFLGWAIHVRKER